MIFDVELRMSTSRTSQAYIMHGHIRWALVLL